MKDLRLYISFLPINSSRKIKMYNHIRQLFWWFKYDRMKYNSVTNTRTFVPTNFYYGHEYWLKSFSGYNDYIYAMIEHGIYFGDNKSKVGYREEWDLGSIITFGNSRISLLKDLYPDYNIFGIGPRIHYVDVDMLYYNEIKSMMDSKSKTLTLFPYHSVYEKEENLNYKLFISNAENMAKDLNISNIIVCLHPADFYHGIDEFFKTKNVILVSGGRNQVQFLPRLKAILSISDIIYSNGIGTHIGYSIYLNKPNVISLDKTLYNNSLCLKYVEEMNLYAKTFDGGNPMTISKEQIELCDYYFGYSYIKTKTEIFNILETCKRTYDKRFGK